MKNTITIYIPANPKSLRAEVPVLAEVLRRKGNSKSLSAQTAELWLRLIAENRAEIDALQAEKETP